MNALSLHAELDKNTIFYVHRYKQPLKCYYKYVWQGYTFTSQQLDITGMLHVSTKCQVAQKTVGRSPTGVP